jgi:hypothetical protein
VHNHASAAARKLRRSIALRQKAAAFLSLAEQQTRTQVGAAHNKPRTDRLLGAGFGAPQRLQARLV